MIEFAGVKAVVGHFQIIHTAGFLQLRQCGDKVLRLAGICFAERLCHADKSFRTAACIHKMLVVGKGDHDQSGAVGQGRMISTHGVLQGMLARAATSNHGVTGHGIGECHVLAGFHIAAVSHGAGQITAYIFNGGKCNHVAHQVSHFTHIDFGGVKQCVKPLVSSEFRRHRCHQLRVNHSQHGKQTVQPAAADFFLRFLIADHTPLVYLAAGAGGRGDAHNRQWRVGRRLALACAT